MIPGTGYKPNALSTWTYGATTEALCSLLSGEAAQPAGASKLAASPNLRQREQLGFRVARRHQTLRLNGSKCRRRQTQRTMQFYRWPLK